MRVARVILNIIMLDIPKMYIYLGFKNLFILLFGQFLE